LPGSASTSRTAARHLPDDERDRWRDEGVQNILDLPGRIPPLVWALDTYVKAGRWGQMRGAPSRWQMLMARTRAAWQRLRSLLQGRARARAQQLHPASIQVQAQPARVTVMAFDAQIVASGTTRSAGSANLKPSARDVVPLPGWRDGMMHLSDADFVAWLSHQRQAFEDDIDRKIKEWRQGHGRL
jgi:hypothetical protein